MQIKDVEMTSFPVRAEFEMLSVGMFFQEKPRTYEPVPRKPYTGPLALPNDPKQCAHVVMNLDAEGMFLDPPYLRCKNTANKGFLCHRCDNQVLNPTQTQREMKHAAWLKSRDYHAEVVQSIINTETRALFGAERETVKLLANGSAKITYLKGKTLKKHLTEVMTDAERDAIHQLVLEAQELGLYEA